MPNTLPRRKAALLVATLMASSALGLHAAETRAPLTIDEALKASAEQHRPVILDFQAVWCYSCYYMASHVLNGKEWEAVERKAIVVEADADSPDGQAWMKKLNASFLPSYVVLDAHGNELGRITAEQPREKFYPKINAILATGDTLDGLKQKAAKGTVDDVANVLEAYQARSEGSGGLDWFATLPVAQQQSAKKQARVGVTLDQLVLIKAETAKDDIAVIAAAQKVLAQDIGCQRPYVLDHLLASSEKLPAAARKTLLAAQRKPLDTYVNSQVLVATPACADQRSAVLTSVELDEALGDQAAATAILDRAITQTRQRLGNNLASDRNLADNLRIYLQRDKRTAELDDYQRKLIAAYPNDYVYAYRYGRSLVDAGKPADALPYLTQAADKAYGANRLAVALQRVKALKALHRNDEAKKLADDVLETNGPWFPKQADALKAELKA
ncbi:thioredoxin family protein [Dyella telluris]|uniref:Thioredoxin family protein n=1 Tax=Dyella telluris TaxID=2763498 RepID=A0A7G8Q311_9GAMM|nr:thioredoxin family protein [Dyella telluris]QNK01169.1 thioredoxin family protein [Dyella telluris]